MRMVVCTARITYFFARTLDAAPLSCAPIIYDSLRQLTVLYCALPAGHPTCSNLRRKRTNWDEDDQDKEQVQVTEGDGQALQQFRQCSAFEAAGRKGPFNLCIGI